MRDGGGGVAKGALCNLTGKVGWEVQRGWVDDRNERCRVLIDIYIYTLPPDPGQIGYSGCNWAVRRGESKCEQELTKL